MLGAESVDEEGPVRKFIEMSSLKDFRPFVVIKRQHLLMHIITPDGISSPRAPLASTTGSLFGLSNLSISNGGQKAPISEPMVLSPASSTPLGSDDPGDGVVSYEEGDERKPKARDNAIAEGEYRESNLEGSTPSIELPPLYIQSCEGTSLYLLGSYAFSTISNCNNCDIVIGAVAGIVRVVGCENVKLTVVCKKLILISCLESTINVACSQPVLLVGENKGIIVGPHNTNYRLLKSHITSAGLGSLTTTAITTSLVSNNCWGIIHEVGTLLDSPMSAGSPTGYAVDAAESRHYPPAPLPLDNIARIQSAELFMYVTIPLQSEERSFEIAAPIELPPIYLKALINRRKRLVALQRNVIDGVLGMPAETGPAVQSAVSHRFLEWLVRTGRAQQVMDLVKIDNNTP